MYNLQFLVLSFPFSIFSSQISISPHLQIAKKIRPNLAVFTDKDAPMKDWQQLDDDKYKFSYSLNRGDFIEIADKTNHNDNKLMGIFMAFSHEKRTIILRPISGEIPEDVNELGFIEVAIKKRLISKC